MRIAFVFAFLSLFTLGGIAPARAEGGTLADVAGWVGQYPFDEVKGTNIRSFPPFVKKLETVLGKERLAYFDKTLWVGVTFPVEQQDGVVVFDFCEKHNCNGNFALIFVRLSDLSFDVCWQHESGRETYWLSDKEGPEKIDFAGCLDALPFDLYKMHKKK